MSEVGKYIILFQGRSGSTFLTEHMRSHPEIRAMYEEFSSLPKDWSAQLDWMSNFYYSKPQSQKVTTVGFKTKLTDIADLELFANFLEDNNIRVIHLFRRNLVKLIVSVIRADMLRAKCGNSNLYASRESLGKIAIDPGEFRKHKKRVRLYRELREYVESLNVEVCHVRYEHLLHNLQGSLGRIWRFLGVSPHRTEAQVLKNTPDRLEDAVENLDELRATFPEYDRFFEEEPEVHSTVDAEGDFRNDLGAFESSNG
ncbi:MAG: sulfotransferase domain-containing protein [Planctomycetota bacterium]|nr:sulfotransferase domain-containing protein [Planctomycetota bacterium]